MPRKQPQQDTIPPTLPPYRAIELLRTQLQKLEETMSWRHDDPRIDAWESTTVNILHGAFGKPNGNEDERTFEFRRAENNYFYPGMPDSKHQRNFVQGQEKR